ncbi:hypothetical protein PO909_012192 [Leuciscus waleckii]
MGVEQVADFASSVLAAISCWRYRAKALLFDQITTDREGCWENWPMNKSGQTPCEEKPDDMNETLTLFGQGTTGEHSSPNTESEEMRMDQSDNYPEMCGTLMARCHTDPEIVDFNNGGREIGDTIKEDSVDFSSMEEGTTPSRSNLSEDVQNMEVDVDVEVPAGLLSSSMLDKASDIPERCTSSLSQSSSLGVEGSFDLESLEDRRNGLLSRGAEPHEKDESQEFRRSTPEQLTETVPDSPFIPDQGPQMKPDTLSKKDRLLIHKIRHYYEHAENQDTSFGVKRRESLSYIPAGLVRNLSQQLNVLADEDVALHRRGSSVTRPTSWSVFNLPGLDNEKKAKDNSDFLVSANGKESVLGPQNGNEQFQPASDMVKVCQDMEVEITGSSEEHQDLENSQMTTPVQETKAETSKVSSDSGFGEPLLILEESDESSTSSPINSILEKDKMQEFRTHPNEDRTFHKVNHPPLPRIISLRSASEDDLVLQDMEKMKNKVFQLARQYSQRIKNSRPAVRQRPKISEINFIPKNLSSVMEERPPGKEKGMPDRTLLPTLNEQDIIPDSKTTSPPSSLCSPGSPQLPYRLNAQRPQSPVQTESFHWPDVKELRSKYNSREDVSTFSRPVLVGRSNSFPERILDDGETSEKSGASRSLSCSSPSYRVTVQRSTSTDSTCSSKTLEAVGLPSLCRVNTLDFDVGTSHALEQPDDFFDPGLDTLSNLIVVERAARDEDSNENQLKWDAFSQSELAMANSKEQNFSAWMDGGHPPCSSEKAENSQHSLVKNLREKFQNLSSYT